jgi:hypothetical protein
MVCRFERRPSWYIFIQPSRDAMIPPPGAHHCAPQNGNGRQWRQRCLPVNTTDPRSNSGQVPCQLFICEQCSSTATVATTCMTPRKNMAMSPTGPGTKNDRAGEGQQQFSRPERSTTKISLVAFTRFDNRNWNKDPITMPQPSAQFGACHVKRKRYQGSLNWSSIVDTIRIIHWKCWAKTIVIIVGYRVGNLTAFPWYYIPFPIKRIPI